MNYRILQIASLCLLLLDVVCASAEPTPPSRIDGFVSIGNSTGLCDTGTSRTRYKNVFIKDCFGVDLYFIGLEHSLENALVESSAARTFLLEGSHLKDGAVCDVTIRTSSSGAPEAVRRSCASAPEAA